MIDVVFHPSALFINEIAYGGKDLIDMSELAYFRMFMNPNLAVGSLLYGRVSDFLD